MNFDNIPARIITMTNDEFDLAKDRLVQSGLKNPISRFPAIDGKSHRSTLVLDRSKITLRCLYNIEYSETRESHSDMPSWAGVGCALSHAQLWEEASKSKNGLIIFEADVVVQKPDATDKSREVFSELARTLQAPPDFLFLGYLNTEKPIEFSSLSKQATSRVYGLQAYYVSPRGAKVLLETFYPVEVQVDSYIGYLVGMKKINAYLSKANAYGQEGLRTSIQTKRVNEKMTVSLDWSGFWYPALALIVVVFFIVLLALRKPKNI